MALLGLQLVGGSLQRMFGVLQMLYLCMEIIYGLVWFCAEKTSADGEQGAGGWHGVSVWFVVRVWMYDCCGGTPSSVILRWCEKI